MFETLHKEAAFVVDAGIVGTAERFHPSRAKNFGGRVKERFCKLAVILAIKEPEKAGLVAVAFIMCTINDRSDSSHRLPVPPGKERVNLPIKAIERGFLAAG